MDTTGTDSAAAARRNRHAAFLVITSAATFSTVPVLVGSAATASPYLFAALWRIGLIAGLTLYVAARHPHLITHQASRRSIRRQLKSPYLLMQPGSLTTFSSRWQRSR